MNNSYQKITDQIVTLLEAGTIPWQRPWNNTPSTRSYAGRPYRGINAMLLASVAEVRGLAGAWLTFKQVKKMGGHVRRGEKGVPVVFWKFIEETDEDGDATGKVFPYCRHYTVFSLCQTEGVERPRWLTQDGEVNEHEVINRAAAIWDGYESKPAMIHGGNRACYYPMGDEIKMPCAEHFRSSEEYYSTLFHEAVHSTGHKSRLARTGIRNGAASFGSEVYSQEELVAEMGAAFLCGEAGIIDRTIDNSTAYLQSWIRVLKGDPKMAVIAGAQAQKAADLILGSERDRA